MPEKDEGLREWVAKELYSWDDKPFLDESHYEMADRLLAKAKPIIEKQQQEKDTAYYAEMIKEAIDRVRTETKKQERERIIEGIQDAFDSMFTPCPEWVSREQLLTLYSKLQALKEE